MDATPLRKIGDQLAILAPNCSGFAKFGLDNQLQRCLVLERVSDEQLGVLEREGRPGEGGVFQDGFQ